MASGKRCITVVSSPGAKKENRLVRSSYVVDVMTARSAWSGEALAPPASGNFPAPNSQASNHGMDYHEPNASGPSHTYSTASQKQVSTVSKHTKLGSCCWRLKDPAVFSCGILLSPRPFAQGLPAESTNWRSNSIVFEILRLHPTSIPPIVSERIPSQRSSPHLTHHP